MFSHVVDSNTVSILMSLPSQISKLNTIHFTIQHACTLFCTWLQDPRVFRGVYLNAYDFSLTDHFCTSYIRQYIALYVY